MSDQPESSDKILLTLLLSIVFMTSLANVTGNGLVLASGAISRACRKRVAALILNLAFADLFALAGLLSLAVDAINHVSTVEYFNEDLLRFACYGKVYGAVAYYLVQIMTMAGIAINRCWRIVYSDSYLHYLRWSGHLVTIALVWLISIGYFSALAVVFGYEAQYISLESGPPVNSTLGGYCIIVSAPASNERLARMSFLVFPGLVALLICATCYAKIFKYFYKSRNELRNIAAECNNRSPTINNNFKNLYLHIATVSILVIGQILGMLLFAAGPLFLNKLYNPFVSLTTLWIYLLNSSINPWLSIVFIKDFESAVQAMSECRSFRSHRRNIAIQQLVEMIH